MTIREALPLIKADIPGMFASAINADHMANHSNLSIELESMIVPDEIILSFNVSERRRNILIVTETKWPGEDTKYNIYRIFPMSDKWAFSLDMQEKSLSEVISHLLQYI